MTIREACLQLSCAPRTLHALLAANGLPSTRGSHTQAGVLSVQAEQIVSRLAQVPLSVVQTPAPTLHDAHELDRLRQDLARLERYAEDTHILMGELIRTVEALQKA